MPITTTCCAAATGHFAISAARQDGWKAASYELHYDNLAPVEKARKAITRMGLWNSVTDALFDYTSKAVALELIATGVLCEQAIECENDPRKSGGRRARDQLKKG